MIPHDERIQRALLAYLFSRPCARASAKACYDELADGFPELTFEEVSERYQNARSKWANRVQFARLHLVEQGFIYRAGSGPDPRHGEWILTEAGKSRAQRIR